LVSVFHRFVVSDVSQIASTHKVHILKPTFHSTNNELIPIHANQIGMFYEKNGVDQVVGMENGPCLGANWTTVFFNIFPAGFCTFQ